MDSIKINETLSDQQSQFYKEEQLVSRDIDLDNYIQKKHIVVLTGLRRSGKSTLLKLFSQKKKGCYVRFDDVRFSGFQTEDFEKVEQYALQNYGLNPAFYLDEIQDVNNWEKWVNDLHAKGYKVFVTGSNAKLLSSEFATYLTGRHLSIIVMPFSFKEILSYNNLSDYSYSTKTKAKIMALFDTYMKKGGFPEVVLSEDSSFISQYYQDIVGKDIILRYGFKLKKDIFQFGLFTLSNIGKIMSYSKVQSAINIKSLETVKSYIDAYTESFVLYTLPRFNYSVKKQLVSSAKIYSGELGFISEVGFHFSDDLGRTLENVVFLQLKRLGEEVYYHKEKQECDFVIKKGLKILSVIQVCYSLDKQNRMREINGLIEACTMYKLKTALLLTYDQEETFEKEGIKIIVQPVWKWLLNI